MEPAAPGVTVGARLKLVQPGLAEGVYTVLEVEGSRVRLRLTAEPQGDGALWIDMDQIAVYRIIE